MRDKQKKDAQETVSEDKTDRKKKKRKKMDGDTLAILTVLAVVIVMAVLFAFLNDGNTSFEVSGKTGRKYQPKQGSSSLVILVTCASLSVFVIVLFIIRKIRDRRRKAKIRAEQREKARRMKELENARNRVKMAKMDEFIMAGQSELEKRKKEEALLRNSKNRRYQENRIGIRGTGEYRRRDLNAYKDELPELDEDTF